MAPSRTASDCFATERVSSGNGTPVASSAAPPKGISWNSSLIPKKERDREVNTQLKKKLFWGQCWQLGCEREREKDTVERSGEEKNVFSDGDDFRADTVAGKESDIVGALFGRRGRSGTRAPKGS